MELFARIRWVLRLLLVLAGWTLVLDSAWAQYPAKPIRVVVPFLAGGSPDTLLRIVAPELSAAWGQPIVVENHAGAGGNIGASVVAKAPPDGYTILFTPSGPLSLNMFLYKDMPFNPRTAFAPISVLGIMPNVLVVGSGMRAKDFHEFLAFAKANPGKLNYGSLGTGTVSHLLTGSMLAPAAGIDVVHVPYKGFPPLLADLVGGRVGFAFLDATNALPRVRQGQLRALANAHPRRFFAFPDVPTFAELGLPGIVASTWVSFVAPAGTPAEIIQTWHKELVRVSRLPEIQKKFETLGVEAWVSTPAELGRRIEDERTRWGEIIERSGMHKVS